MPNPISKSKIPKSSILALDARSHAPITLDLSRPRAILATGKRGSGKTTTLHRLAHIAADQGDTVVVIDPLGALCTLSPDITPLIPGKSLHLNPSDLSTDAWLSLFGLTHAKPSGIALSRALRHVRRKYLIPELIDQIERDDRANDSTKAAITNRLEAAHHDWHIFRQSDYRDLAEIFSSGLHLINLATLNPGPTSLRNLVTALIISRLFTHAQANPPDFPLWIIADEAHNFTTSGALAAKPLTRWAREGRNFGLSIALATQRPATLPADIISQADILIVHHLTLLDDLKAVSRLASTYARDLPAILKGIRDPGQAIIVDDAQERAIVGHIIKT